MGSTTQYLVTDFAGLDHTVQGDVPARRLAQRLANERGEPMYMVDPDTLRVYQESDNDGVCGERIEPEGAALVSLDNGNSTTTVADLTDAQIDRSWSALVSAMAEATRERVHAELAPCTNRAFLARYLELATSDLVVG